MNNAYAYEGLILYQAYGNLYAMIAAEDGVASIKRRRRDLYSDGIRIMVTALGLGRLKEDLESSTWRLDEGGGVDGGVAVVVAAVGCGGVRWCRRRGSGGVGWCWWFGGTAAAAMAAVAGVVLWRVRESGIIDRVDRGLRIIFGFAGKSSPKKFSGDGWWWPAVERWPTVGSGRERCGDGATDVVRVGDGGSGSGDGSGRGEVVVEPTACVRCSGDGDGSGEGDGGSGCAWCRQRGSGVDGGSGGGLWWSGDQAAAAGVVTRWWVTREGE
uniref:Uncharacterized protein n=1 Tax=Tanacetum cinerariifolium TaxID=118510 RepID=A0A6L2K591_TANCI|nr:hypothetical protein [Tanacetum cinerariifolium]